MKICHVVDQVTVGGGSLHIAQLLKDLKSLGHEVSCVTYEDGPVRGMMEESGVEVVLTAESCLDSTLKGIRPDVVHGHTCGGGSHAIAVAHELGIVGGETIHSMVGGTGPGDFEVVEVACLQAARPKSTLIRWAYPGDRFAVTKNWEKTRGEYGIPLDAFVIGRNGRLDGSKAPDLFVEVLARLPGVFGLMVGDGPEYGNLRRQAEALGCSDRLVMPGMTLAPGNYFNAMDLIVYPTRDESVCAGVHEPLFFNLPVICYPVGGMGETILHAKTGLHARSVEEMVVQVRYLIQHPEVARQLGRAGRAQLAENGQDDPVEEARKHVALYRSVLDR